MLEVNKKTLFRIFLIGSGCIVLYWLLHATDSVNHFFHTITTMISPFVAGAAIAFILNVPMRGIERHLAGIRQQGLRRAAAIVLTLLFLTVIITAVFCLLIPQIIQTFETLAPQIYSFFNHLGVSFQEFLKEHPDIGAWLTENTNLAEIDWAALVQRVLSMAGKSITAIISQAVAAIGSVTGFIMDLFISLVFAIYCLFQKTTLARQGRKLAYAFLPEKIADGTVKILRLTNTTFSNFLSGQCIEVCILGCMFAVSMAIFRMPYIPLVSVLVAVTAFIPIIGATIGCVCGAFLILVDDPMQAFWFVIMFLVIQQIEGNLIYPRVVGTSIGLSGMWVIVAVALGGKLMGVAGMFIMIPAASVLYTILKEYTNIRLSGRNIDPQKLIPQSLEFKSKHKEKHSQIPEKKPKK